MITVTSAQLNAWIAAFFWPLTRIMGLISTAPLFGNISVPAQTKIALGVMTALIVSPTIPAVPAVEPVSLAGLLILVQQLIIGLAMGFAINIVFTGIELAGEVSGMTMGLGFATFYDPQSQGQSPAISQFLSLIMLMVYVATDLHLVLLSTLVDSFHSLPISASPMGMSGIEQLVAWGGRIFSAGVQLSLPMIAALLVTNIALGILTRAAPQLNIFGIGFPITISVGLVMIALALPYLATPMSNLFQEAFNVIQHITTATVPPIK
jgi:flagellar biosynthetic protein FliR